MLAALVLIALALFLFAKAARLMRANREHPTLDENARLRALIDRIDRLADDARDLDATQDSTPNGRLSVQVLDEIRAYRRRSDADALGLKNAHSSISRVAPRVAAARDTARALRGPTGVERR